MLTDGFHQTKLSVNQINLFSQTDEVEIKPVVHAQRATLLRSGRTQTGKWTTEGLAERFQVRKDVRHTSVAGRVLALR